MIISKNSWHYKLLQKKSHGVIPTSLCSYFWNVVWTIVKNYIYPFGILILFSVVVGTGALITVGIYEKPEITSVVFIILSFATGLGTLIFTFAIAFLLASLKNLYDDLTFKRENNKSQEKVDKQSGLLVSYLKAKKQKICPIITFTEENKK